VTNSIQRHSGVFLPTFLPIFFALFTHITSVEVSYLLNRISLFCVEFVILGLV